MKGINKVKIFLDGQRVQTAPLSLMTSCSSGTKVNIKIGGITSKILGGGEGKNHLK